MVGMFVFALLAYDAYLKGHNQLAIFFGLSVVVINPVFKVALGRTLWNVLDVFWACVLVFTAYRDER
jgi:hypothetical protein